MTTESQLGQLKIRGRITGIRIYQWTSASPRHDHQASLPVQACAADIEAPIEMLAASRN